MKLALVGGNWGNNPRSSSVIEKIYNLISQIHIPYYENGGTFEELQNEVIPALKEYDVILWFPNIDNSYDKVRNIKEIYPKSILVTSKRNVNFKYSDQELIAHSLMLKSNLLLEFSKHPDASNYNTRVIDPLGTVWSNYNQDLKTMVDNLLNRIKFLKNVTRQATYQIPDFISPPEVPIETSFFNVIKDYAATFHELVKPAESVTRFLGNSSFRCLRGFPSFKAGDYIFVSQRNVDKRYITCENFVPVRFDSMKNIWYSGNNKPSVDTPIQLRLYNYYKNINYMVHSHVYVKDAPNTNLAIPCGGVEEFDEIIQQLPSKHLKNFSINLIGHGCIVASENIDYLKSITFESRSIPEIMEI